jgi:hypothetical protein
VRDQADRTQGLWLRPTASSPAAAWAIAADGGGAGGDSMNAHVRRVAAPNLGSTPPASQLFTALHRAPNALRSVTPRP